ncbi:DUF3859 domain-containing protein [Thaumasiovibrio sp. DFM-14]|uniref:DUF3859 domain-containing protein n=1 Tax=Thaumasiovibrio sp. DFM-14 TaxID=3384792 RepID=UPI0039A22275
MAKSKAVVEVVSFGIYSTWDSDTKHLPKVESFTTDVPAEEDIEFGLTINIKKGKGQILQYVIYHPDIPDNNGTPLPPFDGSVHVRNNDWNFYLGDTVPTKNPNLGIGEWRMVMSLNGKVVAEKLFNVFSRNEGSFWKKRGY